MPRKKFYNSAPSSIDPANAHSGIYGLFDLTIAITKDPLAKLELERTREETRAAFHCFEQMMKERD